MNSTTNSSRFSSIFFQADSGIRNLVRSRGLGDVYKRPLQSLGVVPWRRRVAVSLAQPDRSVAEQLGYSMAPPPTWNVRSKTVDAATGHELHQSDTWMRSDVFDVGSTLDFPPDQHV